MKIIIVLGLFMTFNFGSISVFGQTHQVQRIGFREVVWAVFHPIVAHNALNISQSVTEIADSLAKDCILKGPSGGPLDAFKHCIWMWKLAEGIGPDKARKLGMIHEKVNYKRFKRNPSSNDSSASAMDLLNNEQGLRLAQNINQVSDSLKIKMVIQELEMGNLWLLRVDEAGDFLNCWGEKIILPIPPQWNNGRCVGPSNKNHEP